MYIQQLDIELWGNTNEIVEVEEINTEKENQLTDKNDEINRKEQEQYEEKEYYPSAEEIYPGVEILVQEEDTQPQNKPIITPEHKDVIHQTEEKVPETEYSSQFQTKQMNFPERIRHIVVVGALGHGKTSFVDILIQATHNEYKYNSIHPDNVQRYTDSRVDERERGISIQSSPISQVLSTQNGVSYLLNQMDTPGHISFEGDTILGIRVSDGAILIVDAVEGVMTQTERIIEEQVKYDIPQILIINKIDRQIQEMRLPMEDCYRKLDIVIEEVNTQLKRYNHRSTPFVSPILDTVLFASSSDGWIFSFSSFISILENRNSNSNSNDNNRTHFNRIPKMNKITIKRFCKKLWNNWYFNTNDGTFCTADEYENNNNNKGIYNSFIYFIQEPIYKIYSHVVGIDGTEQTNFCKNKLNIELNKKESIQPIKDIQRRIWDRIQYNSVESVTDIIVTIVPSPQVSNKQKLNNPLQWNDTENKMNDQIDICTNEQNSTSNNNRQLRQDKKYLLIDIVKCYPNINKNNNNNNNNISVFGRIYGGCIEQNDTVCIQQPNYHSEKNEEACTIQTIKGIRIYQGGRYSIPINRVYSDNWIVLDGQDSSIYKYGTIVSTLRKDKILKPFIQPRFRLESHIKVAIEPFEPTNLHHMVTGQRKITQIYPQLETVVEDTGEHLQYSTTVQEMDCALYDLRQQYAKQVDIRISDLSVRFNETISFHSNEFSKIYTNNEKNTIVSLASPQDKQLMYDITSRNYGNDDITILKNLQDSEKQKQINGSSSGGYPSIGSQYNVWGFGPNDIDSNILCNEIPRFTYRKEHELVETVKDSQIEGFRWATREGPLCNEQIRNVKIALVEGTDISTIVNERNKRQQIPAMRRSVYSSFMRATPKLMEPICTQEILQNQKNQRRNQQQIQRALSTVQTPRRGVLIDAYEKSGTPFSILLYHVPLIETFGLDIDIKLGTLGQSSIIGSFSHWDIVPGDPQDTSIVVSPLKIAKNHELARDFMVKTRLRRGLPTDVLDTFS